LCYLQAEGSIDAGVAIAKGNLSTLLDAALGHHGHHRSDPHSRPSSTRTSLTGSTMDGENPPDLATDTSVDEDVGTDREQLTAIQKLLQIAGKDKLMEFLSGLGHTV